ncbi:oligosaccharide flippase family protein [bacterium]|nr:oligosaccharide flippase family protein [bacterium]
MTKTLFNILSNVIARLWGVVLGILLIPLYVNIIGVEAYGLIGFFATLSGSLEILDIGLSSSLNRELARLSAVGAPPRRSRNLVFSMEVVYWVVGLLQGTVVILMASTIATSWVKADKLPIWEVSNAVMLMGGIIALRWPQAIYSGGLMGLQNHVALNTCNVIFGTLKSIGVLVVLYFISATVAAFFIWQIIIAALMSLVLRTQLWGYLPSDIIGPRFSIAELRKIGRFAAGMTGISLASFCLMQLDKIILSKMVSLTDFGYYMLAWTAANGVLLPAGFIANVFLPKLTSVVARDNAEETKTVFHRCNRLISSAVTPFAVVFCFFSIELLAIWLRDSQTAKAINLSVLMLAGGCLCNAYMRVPYYFMLAKGETKFTIYQNIVASVIAAPTLFLFVQRWGINGGASVWLLLNLGYVIICLPLVNQFYVRDHLSKIYLQDIGISLSLSLLVAGVSRFLFINSNFWLTLTHVGCTLAFLYLVICLTNAEYRNFAGLYVRRFANQVTSKRFN